MELNKKDLLEITGGVVTASFVSTIIRGITVVLDLGRSVGSAIRRISENNKCSL